mmetsp:Transcript_14798/g.62455  ORF Transcript_14798/g.62455 Transcript_14798/m.62455 type:complete len:200 (-) Transcript_14798:3038-3637(-)
MLPRQESARQPGHVHPGDQVRGRARARAHRGVRRARRRGGTRRADRRRHLPARAREAPTRSGVGVARRSIRAGAPRRARHRVRPRVRRHRRHHPEESRRRVQEQRHHRRRGAHRAGHAPHGQRGGLASNPGHRSRGRRRQRGRLGHRRGDARPDMLQEGRARAHAEGGQGARALRDAGHDPRRDASERGFRRRVHRGGG